MLQTFTHHHAAILRFFLFLPCFLISTMSTAKETSDLDVELQWMQSEAMVFTASKSVEKISKSAATIDVITAKQIKRMGARDILDALRIVPGLGITRNNMWFREIEVRGVKTTFSEKIVFMLNGHNMNNGLVNGGPTIMFDRLPVDNIQRIEIIRGPASSLYGANAFLGIINIITKKAKTIGGTEVSVQGGSFASQQYNIQMGQELGDVALALNVNFLKSNGDKPWVAADAFTGAASLAPGTADTKRESYNVDLSLDYEGLSFQGKYTKRKNGSNFGAINVLNQRSIPRNRAYFLELAYQHDISDSLSVKGRIYQDRFDFDNFWALYPAGAPAPVYSKGMLFDSVAKNSISGAELSLRFDVSTSNRIIAGLSGEEQKQFGVRTISNYNPATGAPLPAMTDFSSSLNWAPSAKRTLWSAYIEDIWDVVDHVRLVGSVRYDRYNDVGSTVNPKIGITWEVARGYDFKLMYGSAFRAPTFAETYNTNNTILNGNPNIKSEKVRTIEAGLQAKLSDSFDTGVTLFQSNIRNIIGASGGLYQNTNSVKSKGIELNSKFTLSDQSYLAANYTYVNVKDSTAGVHLPDIASNRANIMVNLGLSDKINVYADAFMKNATARVQADTRARVGGYTLINMSIIAKNITPSLRNVEFRGSVYNMFNKAYVSPSPINTIPGDYLMPKISFMLEGRYKL